MRILSVCPSVRLSHACIVTKRGKNCPGFHTIRQNIYPSFLRRRMVGGGRPLLPEITLCLKKVCYKVCVKTVSGRVVRHSLAQLTVQKLLVGATPWTWNFGSKWPRLCEIADFRSIFARSASAVTPVWELQGQSCKAFVGLTIGAKMIGGGDPFYLKFWVKVTALVQNLNNKLR